MLSLAAVATLLVAVGIAQMPVSRFRCCPTGKLCVATLQLSLNMNPAATNPIS